MMDFVYAAFPWVAFGIALAALLTHMNSENIHQDNKTK
ncbi:Uncharacterised protein [Clostridium baratii]|nr:Uncharacterised protein [Clostridium baratii]